MVKLFVGLSISIFFYVKKRLGSAAEFGEPFKIGIA